MLLAIIKGLLHFSVGQTNSGPISSTIVNILLQLLDQATAGLALLVTELRGLCSFTASLATIDMLCFVVNVLIFVSLMFLMARQERMAVHMEVMAARLGGGGV